MSPRLALVIALGSTSACRDQAPTASDSAAAPTGAAPDSQLEALRGEARDKVPRFAKALKGELLTAMKSGGPAKAIEVCNLRAPGIAAEASNEGWTVGRRSTQLRNPDNAPDAWEAKVILDFEGRANAGDRVETLEHAEIVEDEAGKLFRYAKAIPVGGECLTCHGSDIDPEVQQLILARYPNDRAVGYAPDQLRGIFSLQKRVK